MTTAGWIVMSLSITTVLVLLAFCLTMTLLGDSSEVPEEQES